MPRTVLTAMMVGCFAASMIGSVSPAEAQLKYTGCLKKNGKIVRVAAGDKPSKACKSNQTEIMFTGTDKSDALMDKDSGLSKAEREMIVVATSAANECQYCVVAHGAILRIRAKNPLIADQVATNYRKADLTERQKAMLDFALKVCDEAQSVSESDVAALSAQGFSEEDIWDIGAITAFFALSNRMANLVAMRPHDEFYAMGRVSP